MMICANRYNYAGTEQLASYGGTIGDVKARCSLPMWLQTAEFGVPVGSRELAIEAEQTFLNNRVVLYDPIVNVVVHGYVMKVTRDGAGVFVEMEGVGRLHRDKKCTLEFASGLSVSSALANMLLASVPAVVYSSANFDVNSTEIGAFHSEDVQSGSGFFVGDVIGEVLNISDSNGETYDYWCEPRPFRGVLPQLDAAVYRKRNRTAAATWTIRAEDLVPGESKHSSDIYQLATKIIVHFGRRLGTATNNSVVLVDTTTDFAAIGVRPGDFCDNLTKGETAMIAAIGTTTNPNDTCTMRLSGGASWSSGDEWQIRLNNLLPAFASSTGTVTYREVTREFMMAHLTETQAQQMADEFISLFGGPMAHQPLVIGSNTIYDQLGNPWPAWMLMQRPAMVRVQGKVDDSLALSNDLTDRRGLWVVGADWDAGQKLVRIEPGHRDGRFDKLLREAGIGYKEIADAGHRHGHGGINLPPFGSARWWQEVGGGAPADAIGNRRKMDEWLRKQGIN